MTIRIVLICLLTMFGGYSVAEDAERQAISGNRIKWMTASEVNNFGYDVYRSGSEEGPFDRLTQSPIPGAGTIDTPSYYEYLDDAIEPDTIYYYFVESIALDGTREQFTPIYASRPKSTARESAPNIDKSGG